MEILYTHSEICLDGKQFDLEYAANVWLMREDLNKAQIFLDRLDDTVDKFGMSFALSSHIIILLTRSGSNPNLVFRVESGRGR